MSKSYKITSQAEMIECCEFLESLGFQWYWKSGDWASYFKNRPQAPVDSTGSRYLEQIRTSTDHIHGSYRASEGDEPWTPQHLKAIIEYYKQKGI